MVAGKEVIAGVIGSFEEAAQSNWDTPSRRGSTVELDAACGTEVLVTADLHGNRLNFERLLAVADLDARPQRHLVMQEVCHGGPHYPRGGGCMSHLMLEDVARLKVQFPDRFHFLLSNHEWAEITDFPIAKANQMLNLSFRSGLHQMYGPSADQVRQAYLAFLKSCPLAIRVAGSVWICHSAPEDVPERGFDATLFTRRLCDDDFVPHGDLFRLLWGRDFSATNAAAFARLVQADLLIHGHEPCQGGYGVPNGHQIILDCCGVAASYLILPTDHALRQREAVERIQFLNTSQPHCGVRG